MSWQALPLIVLLLVAAALPAALALYAYRHRSIQGALLLVLLLLAMSEWALAYALELWVADPAVKVFWAKSKFVGALALPPLWLALALQHTGRAGWLGRRNLALLAIPPVLMLVLVWSGVVWRYARPDASGTLEVGFGVWFWVIVAYSYGLLLLGAALLVSNFFGSQRLYRKQSAVLLLAVLVPWVANGANLVKLTPVAPLDPTPFAKTRRLVPVFVLSMKRRFAVLLATALVLASGAAACGVREGQEEVEKARQVEKQMEKRQQDLEKKLQEEQEKVEEGR